MKSELIWSRSAWYTRECLETDIHMEAVKWFGVEARQEFPDISMKSELILKQFAMYTREGVCWRQTDRRRPLAVLVWKEGNNYLY